MNGPRDAQQVIGRERGTATLFVCQLACVPDHVNAAVMQPYERDARDIQAVDFGSAERSPRGDVNRIAAARKV